MNLSPTKIRFGFLLLMFPLICAVSGCLPVDKRQVDLCGAPVPGEENLSKNGANLIGEFHGSREMPDFFYGVVCRRVSSKESGRTLVGLELNADEFDSYFKNGNFQKAVEDARMSKFWDDFGDGRSSKAMQEMTIKLMLLKAKYPDRVELIALKEPGNWDYRAAKRFGAVFKEINAKSAFVLAGNAHVRKQPMPHQSQLKVQPVPPFGMNLSGAGVNVVSVNFLVGKGKAWGCLSENECQSLELPERNLGVMRVMNAKEYELHKADNAYDLAYVIPNLSVSVPARE